MADSQSVVLNTMELSVPVAARLTDEQQWQASMDLPRELRQLEPEVQGSILSAVEAALAELQRVNKDTEGRTTALLQPWLRIAIGLWLRRLPNGHWRASVSFTWPDAWADFSQENRAAVLRALQTMVRDTRAVLAELAPAKTSLG